MDHVELSRGEQHGPALQVQVQVQVQVQEQMYEENYQEDNKKVEQE